jgi:hypothetical protein
MSALLLSEQLALIARSTRTGRRPLGKRDVLNACLAGLLVAELRLPDRPAESRTLDAAAGVVADAGPNLRAALSAMDRGLRDRTGRGTWDLVSPTVGAAEAELRSELVGRLRDAATGTDTVDLRTALLLAFTGPARLLEVVVPHRRDRRRARPRIDRALDGTSFAPILATVRRLIAEQQGNVASVGAVVA